MYKCAIILAAGEGKRMKSNIPKVLHKVSGKEMVNHVIDTLRSADISHIDLVVGKGSDRVKKATENRQVTYSFQEAQLGTGDAVICAKKFLEDKKGVVAIITGDAPLITDRSINNLFDFYEKGEYKACILTSQTDNPKGYGRIIRDEKGDVVKIVEHKDCNEEELKCEEINAGMYCFDIEVITSSLSKLNNDNAQNEYYITDLIEIIKQQGFRIGAISMPFDEVLGVNSRFELAKAEQIMKLRINSFHMENGVTILDPNNTYIGSDVVIHSDSIIYPGNIIEGKTDIGSNCILYPNSRIKDSIIGNNVTVQSSVILESKVGENTCIGPFAYIRPESDIGSSVKIGDFVEIKKAKIGDNTKVSHLTYIGDAEVGRGCNFGCGTVVVNYDGKNKYKTLIGNGVFIGCNTNLVSPITIQDNVYIAAGSTITKEVPQGNLAVARATQRNIEGWVEKRGLINKEGASK